MRLNGKCYPFIGAFKDDPELASLACMDMVWHLDEFLANHPQFRKDTNFILSCVSRSAYALNHFNIDNIKERHEVVKVASTKLNVYSR